MVWPRTVAGQWKVNVGRCHNGYFTADWSSVFKDWQEAWWWFRTWIHYRSSDGGDAGDCKHCGVDVVEVFDKGVTYDKDVKKLELENNRLNFRLEKVKQYTRKEQIKIFGLKCETSKASEEDTDQVVIDVLWKMHVRQKRFRSLIACPVGEASHRPWYVNSWGVTYVKRVMENKNNLKYELIPIVKG